MDIDLNEYEFIGYTSDRKRRYRRKDRQTAFKEPNNVIGDVDLTQRNYAMTAYERRYATQTDWIPEYVGQYAISDIGEIVRAPHKTAREASVNKLDLKVHENKLGAPAVDLKMVPTYLAVLVLRTFCRYEKRYEIPFHKDGNRWNYALDNLEWRHYSHTNDNHKKWYATMWKKDEDNINYKPNPHAGKRFKEGVEVIEEPPTIIIPIRKALPGPRYATKLAIGNGKSITTGGKCKALPPPKKADEPTDEPSSEFISKDDWNNRFGDDAA